MRGKLNIVSSKATRKSARSGFFRAGYFDDCTPNLTPARILEQVAVWGSHQIPESWSSIPNYLPDQPLPNPSSLKRGGVISALGVKAGKAQAEHM